MPQACHTASDGAVQLTCPQGEAGPESFSAVQRSAVFDTRSHLSTCLQTTQEELQQALDASSRNACFKDRCQVLERDLEQRRGTQQRLEAALRLAETNSNDLRNQLQISNSTAATLAEDLRRLAAACDAGCRSAGGAGP